MEKRENIEIRREKRDDKRTNRITIKANTTTEARAREKIEGKRD